MSLWDVNNLHKQFEDFRRKEYISGPVSAVVKDLDGFYNCYNIMTANTGGHPIFRVRKIKNGEEHDTCQSVWCPPAKYVTQIGRANDIGESIFYGAFDPLTAMLEAQVSIDDVFSMAIYYLSPLQAWNMTSVVINVPKGGMSQSKQLVKHSIALSKFVVEEFTRNVSDECRFEYKKSCAIAKILLGLPNKDSIIYPSMKNMDKINIAMIEDMAKRRMQLISVCKCKLVGFTDDNKANVEVLGLAQSEQDSDLLSYDSIPMHVETISHDTWINKAWSFGDDFGSNKTASFEEMMKDMRDG